MTQKSDVNVKVETYVKVIMELGLNEARVLRSTLMDYNTTHPTDPIYQALTEALEEVAA